MADHKTAAQLEAEIDSILAGAPASAKKTRKPRAKKSSKTPTKLEQLAEEVDQAKARARSAFRSGGDSASVNADLFRVRQRYARALAEDLQHSVLGQGESYECFRCGASGRFDTAPEGAIFRETCSFPMFPKKG